MNRVKLILSYLFGFITSVLLSILVILLLCKYSILNVDYIKNVLGKNNYYSEVYKGTLEEIEAYMISSGLEEEVLNNIFDESIIEKEVDNYLDSIYSGSEYVVDSKSVKDKLSTNIDNYLSSSNLEVTDKKELNLFINDIAKIYEDEIKFYNAAKFGKKYLTYGIKNIDKIISFILGISLISIIILLLLRCKFISSTIIGSGLILLFIRFMIFEKIDIKNILIISDYFSKVIKAVLNDLEHNILMSSILLIGIGLIILLIELLGKKIKIKKFRNLEKLIKKELC